MNERIREQLEDATEVLDDRATIAETAEPNHSHDLILKDSGIEQENEVEFEQMVLRGTKAWADTPDDWVDELRGGADLGAKL